MNTMRSFLVVLGFGAVVFAFLYAARPQWFPNLTARSSSGDEKAISGRATLVIQTGGRASARFLDADDQLRRRLLEMEEDGLPPSRVNPYLLVINYGDRTIHYYQLSPAVKSVNLKSPSPDVAVKTSRVLSTRGPLQLEFWVPNHRELVLDVEYALARK